MYPECIHISLLSYWCSINFYRTYIHTNACWHCNIKHLLSKQMAIFIARLGRIWKVAFLSIWLVHASSHFDWTKMFLAFYWLNFPIVINTQKSTHEWIYIYSGCYPKWIKICILSCTNKPHQTHLCSSIESNLIQLPTCGWLGYQSSCICELKVVQ